MLGGAVHGLIKLLFGPSFVHPLQILLDYPPLPYAVVGLAGFGALRRMRIKGTIVAVLARYVVHVVAGVVFWGGHYAPEGGTPALLYSLVYNANYLLIEGIIMVLVIQLLGKREEIFSPPTAFA